MYRPVRRLVLCLVLALAGQTTMAAPQTPPQGDAAAIDRLLAQGPDLIKKGSYDQLGANAEEAVRLSRQINDQTRLMRSLNSLMSADFYRSRYEDAVGIGREVVRLALAQTNRMAQAQAFNNMGSALREVGDLEEALDYLTRASDLFTELGDRLSAANASRNIGVLYGELGDIARAEALIRSAIATAQDMKNTIFEEVFLASLAPVEQMQGRLQDSMRDYERILALDEKNQLTGGRVEVLAHMASLQSDLGLHEKAIATATEALGFARGSNYAEAEAGMLGQIGRELRLVGRPAEALDYLTKANDLVRTTGTPHVWLASLELARTLRALGRAEDAVAPARDSLAAIERVRLKSVPVDTSTGSVIALSKDAFLETIDLLCTLGRSTEAFEIAERYRARGFLDLIAAARAGVRRSLTPDQRAHEETLTKRLDDVDRKLQKPSTSADARHDLELQKASLENEFETFRAELRRTNAAYANVQYPDLLGVERVQRDLLAPDAALVEYVLGDERSFVWVISKNAVRFATLPKRREIEVLVSSFRSALMTTRASILQNARAGDADRISSELYATLVAPIAPALRDIRTLIIVPDGTMTYLPFEALRAPAQTSPRAPAGFLLQRFLIRYSPSATALHAIESTAAERPVQSKALLAFGDPNFGDPAADAGLHLTRLPYTRNEVNSISQLFTAANRSIYLGDTASRTTLSKESLDRYRYIHFATHGLIDGSKPAHSGIALSPTAAAHDNGVLEMRDIMDLRLNADLVTLSACDTALGQLVSGEGVVGLTRSFLSAGARSVVVSLWSVNDAATAELMRSFYSNLMRGMAKDAALRDAKLKLLANTNSSWRQPYFWAPFVLIGER